MNNKKEEVGESNMATKTKKKEKKPIVQPVNIIDVVKQAIVQVKYEEIGSWLVMHKTPLFYAHKHGFSVVDQKFLDEHPKLKKELDKMVEELTKKKVPKKTKAVKESKSVEYIG